MKLINKNRLLVLKNGSFKDATSERKFIIFSKHYLLWKGEIAGPRINNI
jgi:hypothetical protein